MKKFNFFNFLFVFGAFLSGLFIAFLYFLIIAALRDDVVLR